MAILPTSRVLDARDSNLDPTQDDILRAQEKVMCYFADRVNDKNDLKAARSVLSDYAEDILMLSAHDDAIQSEWARKARERMLLVLIPVETSLFAACSNFLGHEPSLQFFESIARKIQSRSLPLLDYCNVCAGLDNLLTRVEFPNLLPVLCCLTELRPDVAEFEEPGFVEQWIHDGFVRSRCRSGLWYRKEDAAIFIDICKSFNVKVDVV